jgi:hypothetical protein
MNSLIHYGMEIFILQIILIIMGIGLVIFLIVEAIKNFYYSKKRSKL